jgi:hypothetical protein
MACGVVSRDVGFDDAGDSDDGPGEAIGDSGALLVNDATPSKVCVNLECHAPTCGPNGDETTLTGHVYDPAGKLPLYNVYVYVPNGTPEAMTVGNPTCTPCQAPASGSPMIGTTTDAEGKFTLRYIPKAGKPWGVPTGDNIPLVVQVGKWRRQLVVPHIDACTTLDLDKVLGKDLLRLPRKSSEGDMPLIAFTSGCDPAECFLRNVGIDDSEFVPPDSPTGHVHFYTGRDDSILAWGDGGPAQGSSIAGGNTPEETYQWWSSSANLLKYDIVFNACECFPFDRRPDGGADSYAAMEDYLNGGGRLFTTHYHYNWFTASADLITVADWTPGAADHGVAGPYYINTTFPKGKAYGDWLLANHGATATDAGVEVDLVDTRWDMSGAGPPTYPRSTLWIFAGGWDSASLYTSFNTPIAVAPSKQCGRAVFSDVHLSGSSYVEQFPAECSDPYIDTPQKGHAKNEKALEFLFFDLSSCVQDDTQEPQGPPPR